MARINNLENFLTDVATAIKTKKESNVDIPAANFDTEILSIQGGTDTSDATATAADILATKTAYISTGETTGTMPNNGALSYTPSDNSQTIPAGYTSGGTVAPLDTSSDYIACNTIANSILGPFLLNTELDYIESTGAQYINTNYAGNSVYQFEFGYMPLSNSGYESYLSGKLDDFTIGRYQQNSMSYVRINDWVENGVSTNIGTRNDVSLRNGVVTFNDTVLTSSISTSQTVSSVADNIIIFNNSDLSRYSKVRFYYLKLYNQAGTLLRDFVPVKDINDVVCLFDKVSQTNFYNSGTGAFVAGPVKEGN